MSVLDKISPQQRKLLLYGVPVVGVLAVGLKLGRGTATPAVPADTRPTGVLSPLSSGGATDVLGVGQLADFESVVSGALGGLADAVNKLGTAPAAPGPVTACVAPIYPIFKSGPVDCPCPPGTILIDHRAGNRYSCASPNDYTAFQNLVRYVEQTGQAPF